MTRGMKETVKKGSEKERERYEKILRGGGSKKGAQRKRQSSAALAHLTEL